jgi:sulfur-oxidizing protein SoxY
MMMNRRQALALSTGVAAALVTGLVPGLAWAGAPEAEKMMLDFAGGKQPETGKITLTAPEIAENGNTVPISINVDSKMTDGDLVSEVMILADGNPNPEVATFQFTAMSGVAAATTRMRLAKTQNVLAIAKMADGSVYMDRKEVKVTIGGCGG